MLVLFCMVYNNSEYLLFQEHICRKLAKKNYFRVIIDCSENGEERRRLESIPNSFVIDGKWINRYRLSEAVGVATNFMMQIAERVGVEHAIILDVDVVPLALHWDELVLENLDSGIDALGIPYNPLHEKRRVQNIPTVFFFAFCVEKISKLKLDWRTKLPTFLRLKLYWFYRKLNNYVFAKEAKLFDFEMSQFALMKIKRNNIKTLAFEIHHPWEDSASLRFDLGNLPKDKSKVDPLKHDYQEEWHFNGIPFATHQRRGRGVRIPGPDVHAYISSFNYTNYSKDWIKEIKNYLYKTYKLEIDY